MIALIGFRSLILAVSLAIGSQTAENVEKAAQDDENVPANQHSAQPKPKS